MTESLYEAVSGQILRDIQLSPLVSLKTPAVAAYYLKAESLAHIKAGLQFARSQGLQVLVLGGGSNVVLTGNFGGLILHIALKGQQAEKLGDELALTVAAGENWHELVRATVVEGYRGIENLALIPGTVGAAPVQNIGAYGVELKDVVERVQVLDTETNQCLTLSNADCLFAYRDSIFKSPLGKKYIILSVTIRLSRARPLCLEYGDIGRHLGVPAKQATVAQVMDAVVRIRQEKLPDPTVIPNTGSFFKNPVVDCQQFRLLKRQFPDLVSYPLADGSFKLAAGWLIDQLGWRGYRDGAVGVHDRQALVLVNPGCGTGAAVVELAARIQRSVKERYGVALEIEPVVV